MLCQQYKIMNSENVHENEIATDKENTSDQDSYVI